ncbi:DNA oxidative demethylase AlkB [Methylophaga sp.]|uniref:DNA oxidative demethylase AlkB n=1 Tax=Methylophaga sp. TaxID=2024840 RepID=UPI002A189E97|nr:DNA oxidative demethylase AlkB [uncultured Methylophaga sp.]
MIKISDQSYLVKGAIKTQADELLTEIDRIISSSPLRQMQTKRGHYVGAKMTNCGEWGWVSDKKGYRYSRLDPLTNQAWPAMPTMFKALAMELASSVGFDHFQPDVCLINQYIPKVGMGLHQDKDEHDLSQPIVSLSLGVPAIFQFGGFKRSDQVNYHLLQHGDVVIWGGIDRLRFHGIQPLKLGHHPQTGQTRYNLTFRDTGNIID